MPNRVEKPAALGLILTGLRNLGKTIVLAVGGFENLRPADIRYLEDAKSRGHYLVVGVNPRWPYGRGKKVPGLRVSGADRAEVLAGLRCVDYVTVYEGETADELLRILRPTILAYSPQFTERSAPERAVAQELEIAIAICGGTRRPAPSGGRRLLARKKGDRFTLRREK